MKIQLYAFGRKLGEPMEVPENTTPTFKLALQQPLTVISGFSGEKIGERPPLQTIAEFEWIGKYEWNDNVRVYNLTSIDKI